MTTTLQRQYPSNRARTHMSDDAGRNETSGSESRPGSLTAAGEHDPPARPDFPPAATGSAAVRHVPADLRVPPGTTYHPETEDGRPAYFQFPDGSRRAVSADPLAGLRDVSAHVLRADRVAVTEVKPAPEHLTDEKRARIHAERIDCIVTSRAAGFEREYLGDREARKRYGINTRATVPRNPGGRGEA